jgi:hypothetical protein
MLRPGELPSLLGRAAPALLSLVCSGAALAAPSAIKALPDPQLDQWAAASNLIFEATLAAPAKGKGEFDEFHDPAATAVGKITSVLDLPATPPLGKDLVGTQVTLFLAKADPSLVGQLVLFGTLEAAGDGVAVQLVGAVIGPATEVAPRLKASVERLLAAQLQARLNSCDAVVLATVARVVPQAAPVPGSKVAALPSEHDPGWYDAELTAEAWLLGQADKKPPAPLLVRFALSFEGPWEESPHPTAGEKMIWLLDKAPRAPGSSADHLLRFALEPSQRPQVEALLKKRTPASDPHDD